MHTQQDEKQGKAAGGTAEEPVGLRGHHFLCLLTFRGLGYTPAFVENLTAVAAAITRGRPVILVDGPDDICNALSARDRIACDHDCARAETRGRDELAIADVATMLGVDMRRPFVLTREMVLRLRKAFSNGAVRTACFGCSWENVCDGIAKDNYSKTRLFSE